MWLKEERLKTNLSVKVMAVAVTAAEQQAALEKASADLKFLLSKEGVSVLNQAKIFHVGITTMQLFSTFVSDEKDLRDMLKVNLELDPSQDIAHRVQVAAFTCAFLSARVRREKQSEVDAEMQSRQMIKPLPKSDYLAMRIAFESKFDKMDDKHTPSRDYLERKMEDIESGEWRAEPLSEAASKDELEPDILTPVWDASGKLTVKKQSTTVPLPVNPEELRRRLHILGSGLVMLGMRHTNRPELQGISPNDIHKYLDYLLGEHCYGMVAKSAEGYTVATVPWALVIAYEHAIRKRACRLLNEGAHTSFLLALREAMLDPVTKERNFTTPLALSASKSKSEVAYSDNRETSRDRGLGSKGHKKSNFKGVGKKGNFKGSGKGSSKGASKTPEGKPICFRFNNPRTGCTSKKCRFSHSCGFCFSKAHPSYQCPGKSKGPDTAGGAA